MKICETLHRFIVVFPQNFARLIVLCANINLKYAKLCLLCTHLCNSLHIRDLRIRKLPQLFQPVIPSAP
jgi:hypothetical protein